MGCSAAKNLTVEPLNGATTNGTESANKAVPRRPSEIPPLEGQDPETEMLDPGLVKSVQETNNGMSFEIAFDGGGEEAGESIIRKHPPKRFQRLEEQQMSPTLSLAKLQEKLDEAEQRRQQILQQRVQSAKVRKALKRQTNVGENGEEIETPGSDDDENHLKVPPDIPPTPLLNNES